MSLDVMEYHKVEYSLVQITKRERQPWVRFTTRRTVYAGVIEGCIV
jgi:hypothetical protein